MNTLGLSGSPVTATHSSSAEGCSEPTAWILLRSHSRSGANLPSARSAVSVGSSFAACASSVSHVLLQVVSTLRVTLGWAYIMRQERSVCASVCKSEGEGECCLLVELRRKHRPERIRGEVAEAAVAPMDILTAPHHHLRLGESTPRQAGDQSSPGMYPRTCSTPCLSVGGSTPRYSLYLAFQAAGRSATSNFPCMSASSSSKRITMCKGYVSSSASTRTRLACTLLAH